MARERLQKLIAAAGLCSRRNAEVWLRSGQVLVNGSVAQLGDRADPDLDQINVQGKPLAKRPDPLLILLNKPAGVVCSCHDPEGRTTVLDLLPDDLSQGQGLHPVGRLDAESRGALLLSNQGDITLKLTHPRYGHHKTYLVWLRGEVRRTQLEQWARGVELDGQASQPVQVSIQQTRPNATCLELVMGEGRNRQIRRTAALLGYTVLDLQRLAIGPIGLGELPEGRWRRLDRQEWRLLAQAPN
ncbi:rRNA pseudouridine synthase [Cyanobium sp. HWJ4-Hawea]|uniref:pseudouridine synthase n=1 Tax=Cyanobium sp. HWJ4-Hawea TaxID=2823713 RepID=UPI0020CE2A91|nr:pseudouridine synthase [Cyanobium sp. HWJ4-Hawea]MCP9810003.1 rRNA pseudouridine synthase [Cyanobium sp. HWJ4-Hawea]